jgi:hypothetical protein
MNIFIRNCCLICLTLIVGCSSAQQAGNQYAFKEVGWSLTLPPQFSVIDSSKTAALNQRGKKLIEESNDIKADFSGTKTLITAMKGNNYFNSTITPFGPKDGDYNTSCKKVKDLIFNTFVNKIPNAKIDSSSTAETVGGLEFDKFHIVITMHDKVLFNMFLLSKLYKGFDFGISYLYLDEISKGQIESILNSSRFR